MLESSPSLSSPLQGKFTTDLFRRIRQNKEKFQRQVTDIIDFFVKQLNLQSNNII